jgi:hypothetical protein
MTIWIQILLVVGLILTAVYLVRSTPSASHQAIRRILVILAVLAGVVAVIWTGLLSMVAHALGVGRGTDLLLYVLVVVFLIESVSNYKRSVTHARTTSALARELALVEARLEDAIAANQTSTPASTKKPAVRAPQGK